MRQFHGLDQLLSNTGTNRIEALATALQHDLQHCHCHIMGCIAEQTVLLASLALMPDSLIYHRFEQRLDWLVEGAIVRNDCVPLTYRLQGQQFAISGRCSVLPQVCGVDLYLSSSYTCTLGDKARQGFSLSLKKLLNSAHTH